MDDQARWRHIERVVLEGQGLGHAPSYVDTRMARSACLHGRLGRIERRDVLRADESDEPLKGHGP